MQNDLTPCEGPTTATVPRSGRAGSRRHRTRCALLALPLAVVLIAPGATALAAEATTGYGQTTPPPKTETTPAPKTSPKQETAPTETSSAPKETAPAKEAPAKETAPATSSKEPTATQAKAKSLPFTGLDLRWVTVGGLLLVAMGASILTAQRRRGTGR